MKSFGARAILAAAVPVSATPLVVRDDIAIFTKIARDPNIRAD
jgi:hypothetical protein